MPRTISVPSVYLGAQVKDHCPTFLHTFSYEIFYFNKNLKLERVKKDNWPA